MPLYLALSCLQGRPMQAAAAELLALAPDGLQLTPGNAPTPGFAAWLVRQGIPYLMHHGFCWQALRQRVWCPDGSCAVRADSVHPPQTTDPAAAQWTDKWDQGPALETMYPGYALGSGDELEQAMDRELPLAVDVSHLHIQFVQGAVTERTWQRLQAYPHIREIHLSANDGRSDQHRPLTPDSFGLGWARERGQEVPVILECYMHKLSEGERHKQVDLARGPAS